MDELHDEQLSLERELSQYGIKRYDDMVAEARNRGMESSTPASMSLIKGAIEPIAKGIDEERKKIKSDRAWIHGRLFVKLEYIKSDVLAYLTIKALLDCISRRDALNTMAIKVGRAIEDDLMLTSFMKQNKPLMDKVRRSVKKRSQNYKYQKNVLKNSANKAGLEFDYWPTSYRLGLGLRLIDIVISTTNLFEITHIRLKAKHRPAKHLVPTGKTLEWLLKKNNHLSVLRPLRLPMVVSPKPWTSLLDGGYFSLKSSLIRFNNELVLKDYSAMSTESGIEFNQVFDVVNAIQETPWKVNKKVLEVVDHFWNTVEGDVLLDCLPRKNEIKQETPYPDNGTEEEQKEWKHIASKMYKENIRTMSHKVAFSKMLWVAERFKDKDRIYYPHNLDFRGRVYPMCDFLHPQGDEVCRGLLQFAEGRPIKTQKGMDHFLMYGASLYGLDKKSDDEKMIWVNKSVGIFIGIADSPIDNWKLWADADKPWQFLAWCIEFERWYVDRDTPVHLPVMVDGTCNGLQHLSALMKDQEGGESVNLVDTGLTPNDIYQMVSDEANKLYKGDIKIDRKLCKRPVMTTPYGSTIYGIREQIKSELIKRSPDIGTDMEWDNWEIIKEVSDSGYRT
jgi:DNA-directed RNA polymerase